METLRNNGKLAINDRDIYGELYYAILECVHKGDRLVMYKDKDKTIHFESFCLYKNTAHRKVLYVSKYIEKDLFELGGDDEDKFIDEVIMDIKERTNIHIARSRDVEDFCKDWYSPDDPWALALGIAWEPVIISIVILIIIAITIYYIMSYLGFI